MKLLLENWRKYIDEDCESDEIAAIAGHAHHGQYRRGPPRVPYITHPEAVAKFAKEYGYSDLISNVAMLHDTLEDYEDVEEMSAYIEDECPEALPIVQELTHEEGVDYTEYVLSLGEDALIVKLLDMLHNSQDIKPDSRQYNKYYEALVAIQDRFNGKPDAIKDSHWADLRASLGEKPEEEAPEMPQELEEKKKGCFDHSRNKTFKGKVKCIMKKKGFGKKRASAYVASVVRKMEK